MDGIADCHRALGRPAASFSQTSLWAAVSSLRRDDDRQDDSMCVNARAAADSHVKLAELVTASVSGHLPEHTQQAGFRPESASRGRHLAR